MTDTSLALAIPLDDLVELDRHLSGLRPSLARFADDAEARREGHYRPADEEAMLPIWASWWRGRLALVEILEEGQWLQDAAAFLRSFAACLLLIGNARWLRDAIHENRLLRKYLNQAVPELGVPADSYDRVMRNLLKARSLWRISTALERYHAVAATMPAQPIHAFIESHLEVLQVPGRRLVRGYLRTLLRRIGVRIGRRGIARACFHLQRWVGSTTAEIMTQRDHEPALPEAICERLVACLRPGDVLISRKEHCLTNHLLPGYWPHAILYVGITTGTDGAQVIEAQRDGVLLRPMTSVYHNDGLIVLRPVGAEAVATTALERARKHVGKAYDFDFDFRTSERLVCTEVVYRAYDGLDGIFFTLTSRFGRPTLSAEDILRHVRDRGGFTVVAVRMPDGPWLEGDVGWKTALGTFR